MHERKLLSITVLCLGLLLSSSLVQAQAVGTALQYVQDNAAELGLAAEDVADVVVTNAYTSKHTGVTHVYLNQQYQGVGVHNAVINVNVLPNGRVMSVGNRFVAKLADKITSSTAGLTAIGAAEASARHLGLSFIEPLTVLESTPGPAQESHLSGGGASLEAIPTKLVYQLLESGEVRLAWDVGIYTLDAQDYWSIRVDAASGVLLDLANLVVQDDWGVPDGVQSTAFPGLGASTPFAGSVLMNPDDYRVFPLPAESPLHPSPGGTPHTLVTNPADATASPFAWHDTNGAPGAEFTDTRGNNVDAYADRDGNNVPDPGSRPNGGPSLVFDFPIDLSMQPPTYVPGAVVNLFYWNNIIHDVLYQYGFDEPSGNFQVNNYGNGGASGDDVRAEAQDNDLGGSNCNANFFTPSDGNRPRMQMFTCNIASPERDGDLDNGVIIHEYGHGISNRLTGGPANVGCLSNTEQMGEGWSDYYGLMMTQQVGDVGPTGRGTGTYLFGQPPTGPGIRPRPYSTSFAVNNFTYDNIKTASIPHGIGHVWATMTWDLNWALIGGDPNFPDIPGGGNDGGGGGSGFDPDLYNGNGGNNLALQLITDGMKLQPCSPGFVDGRNAILAADAALTGGLNECPIWHAFARRGLGFSASQGSSNNRGDGTEAFDLPPGVPSICGSTQCTIDELIQKVTDLVHNGALEPNHGTALLFLANKAKDEIIHGQNANAIATLNSFIAHVNLYVSIGDITLAQGQDLIDCANEIIAGLFGASKAGLVAGVPEVFSLEPNYPNPFNPTTAIGFQLPEAVHVHLAVYDVMGREVARLVDRPFEAGTHRVTFEANGLPSGTYFYRIIAGDFVQTQRMVLLK